MAGPCPGPAIVESWVQSNAARGPWTAPYHRRRHLRPARQLTLRTPHVATRYAAAQRYRRNNRTGGDEMAKKAWYPIKLTAHVATYYFGERLIAERLGKAGLPDGIVAETWQISDYRDARGTVTNGAFAGRTLHSLAMEHPDELVGAGWRGPHFPLLDKFLDASH